jgi:hypothetical protein
MTLSLTSTGRPDGALRDELGRQPGNVYFKLNTFGEESFLRLAVAAIKGYDT